ncbi:MAG: hypothetical protein ACRBBJ_11850 [Rhodomicrobiaceae bacterium]|nr:MAG: hypothetical protein DHS20C07_04300 [Methyloligella sp.]
MPICKKCGLDVCSPCVPVLEIEHVRTVVVASYAQLVRRSHYNRLSMVTRDLLEEYGLSRRAYADWLADILFDEYIRTIHNDGRPYLITDTLIDDVFNNDGSFRWLSDFLEFADQPIRQAPQKRILERLRVIDLGIRIVNPARAKLIAK